ncbi:beta-lactamase related protein [Janibacter sp. HTCC2649]|uniref:serine hydrolase n=1 Tax=Janibacter sp. HTCC2649 TaxID=313589 RepID=UPI0000670897|nr:serine hydrolase [Janibacter sp. HTCC2649]EAQ00219.1 beta-lactamase related protein [Janibacter sp. HTCC2649]
MAPSGWRLADVSLNLELLPEVDWSIRIVDLGSGEVLASHDPDRLLSTASVGKVFALIELAERLRDGRLAADQLLDRRSVAPVADSGLWQHLSTDVLPLTDVARLVGAVSDNLATNVLIDLLGQDSIRERAAQWAPRGSDLVDVVRGLRGPDDPPHLSLGCASDHVDVFARMWSERTTRGSVGDRVLGWLAPGMDLSMVASAWHQDPLSHAEEYAGPILVNKTGTNLGVRADVGVIDSGRRATAYAVLATWSEVPMGHRRDDVMDALRDIGKALRLAVG